MHETIGIKVFIRNLAGEYLAGEGEDWSFTSSMAQAHIFDYAEDQVADQLAEAQRDFGVNWVAHPVDPDLIGETCDICSLHLRTTEAIYNGTSFVCPACHVSQTNNFPLTP